MLLLIKLSQNMIIWWIGNYFYAPRKFSGEHIVADMTVRLSHFSCPGYNFWTAWGIMMKLMWQLDVILRVCRVWLSMMQHSKWPTGGHIGKYHILAISEVNSSWIILKFTIYHPLIKSHNIYYAFFIILKFEIFTNFFNDF